MEKLRDIHDQLTAPPHDLPAHREPFAPARAPAARRLLRHGCDGAPAAMLLPSARMRGEVHAAPLSYLSAERQRREAG
eukprot:4159398-Pleurochrysis_carterae.AAC.2